MGLRDRLRRSRASSRLLLEAERLIEAGERAQAEAAPPAQVRQSAEAARLALLEAREAGYDDGAHLHLRLAQSLFLLGRPHEALAPAYDAAKARPYDVESRVTHGRVRLALGDAAQAMHEFESVLEEFGGDPEANAGLRAAHLALGELPLDPADEVEIGADREAGAEFLISAWEQAGAVAEHLAALRQGTADPGLLTLLERIVDRRDRSRQIASETETEARG
jgi:tetratricopeptide (TPR) repeat protein